MGELSRLCSLTPTLLPCSSASCPCFSCPCCGNRPGREGLAPKSWMYRAGTEGVWCAFQHADWQNGTWALTQSQDLKELKSSLWLMTKFSDLFLLSSHLTWFVFFFTPPLLGYCFSPYILAYLECPLLSAIMSFHPNFLRSLKIVFQTSSTSEKP